MCSATLPTRIAIETLQSGTSQPLTFCLKSRFEFKIGALQHLAGGNRNRDIAELLLSSEETAKVHIEHILEKLGASDRTHAVAIAVAGESSNFENQTWLCSATSLPASAITCQLLLSWYFYIS